MNIEHYRTFCLQLPFVTEGFPFGGDTLVFKVKNKMFALAGVDEFASINLKCDPDNAIALREKYSSVQPGYHMSKVHWNTILMDGSISNPLLEKWIMDSYMLVVKSLSKSDKADVQIALEENQ
jgi:predicted DNA-binding protein (MmcQ/YjbR family)